MIFNSLQQRNQSYSAHFLQEGPNPFTEIYFDPHRKIKLLAKLVSILGLPCFY